MSTQTRLLRFVPGLIGTLVVIALALIFFFFVRGMMEEGPHQVKKTVHKIALIKPPPPPKIEEKPPEPEIEEEKVEIDEPEAVEEEIDNVTEDLPNGDLGLDAEGGAGTDAFGLRAKKGGRDLIGSGSGGFRRYANRLKSVIEDSLSENDKVRSRRYSVVVKIWIDGVGTVDRLELVNSTGDSAVDDSLRLALNEMSSIGEPPPEDMPQPVRLRISSRI